MSTRTSQPSGLRARKKQQTRENISHHATRLFLARGFDNVTIAEVAAAADVAKMTVTNYFPRKEDLALDLHEEFVTGLARIVRERAVGESALAALHRAYRAGVADRDPVIGFSGPEFARMITASPALTARLREFHDERERALADALAEATAAPAGDLLARIAAAQLAGAHRVLFEETLSRTVAGESNETIAEALAPYVDAAFGQLAPSLGEYAVRGE